MTSDEIDAMLMDDGAFMEALYPTPPKHNLGAKFEALNRATMRADELPGVGAIAFWAMVAAAGLILALVAIL